MGFAAAAAAGTAASGVGGGSGLPGPMAQRADLRMKGSSWWYSGNRNV